ncbi:MAG: UDP-3-O-acyl-N-acetylglucosamine deacetylase [Planctomycetaceae bacterium]|nr:UDP-3-O-acyl-N-acetylglucosamine deacetylase [Planctomycetaceae bacterium]
MSVVSYSTSGIRTSRSEGVVPAPHFRPGPNWSASLTDWALLDDHLSKVRRFQQTLALPTYVEGFGFWTGEDVRVEFRPADCGTGIVFVRTDLDDQPRIPAHVRHREMKARQTSLSLGEARVDMIEHLMAALAIMRIDNCEVWVDGAEMPGLDGSSKPFYQVLKKAGTAVQKSLKPVKIVREPFVIGNEKSYIAVKPVTSFETVFRYHLNYGTCRAIGTQHYTHLPSKDAFARELVSCRTFLTKTEADALLSQGLCQRVTYKNVLVFDENGPIGNSLYFPNECARHKVLDMLGDFALSPFELVGEFDAHCSGHQLNADCLTYLIT